MDFTLLRLISGACLDGLTYFGFDWHMATNGPTKSLRLSLSWSCQTGKGLKILGKCSQTITQILSPPYQSSTLCNLRSLQKTYRSLRISPRQFCGDLWCTRLQLWFRCRDVAMWDDDEAGWSQVYVVGVLISGYREWIGTCDMCYK